jgi:hypothetical protein
VSFSTIEAAIVFFDFCDNDASGVTKINVFSNVGFMTPLADPTFTQEVRYTTISHASGQIGMHKSASMT